MQNPTHWNLYLERIKESSGEEAKEYEIWLHVWSPGCIAGGQENSSEKGDH